MDVSIIIVNYKTPELVIDCVASIKEKTLDLDYEIIVVDNASEDQSTSIIKKNLEDAVLLIESSVNLGFGKANNLGVKYASGKYVFLLNSDTLLINNAIKILFDYLEDHPDVGVVGGNLYTIGKRPSSSYCTEFDDIESVKADAKWSTIIKKIFMNRYIDKKYSEEQKENYYYKSNFNFTDQNQKVAYIFGTDMMLAKELYENLGGFDPDFFMYAEEEELSWRITEKGYQIVNVPSAKIIHYDGASVKKNASFSARQYSMRLDGTFMYYLKRFKEQGVHDCYKYKMLKFNRILKIGKLFHRTKLVELTKQQETCLKEVYTQFLNKQEIEGGKK